MIHLFDMKHLCENNNSLQKVIIKLTSYPTSVLKSDHTQ